jgi:hypothetical protein
MPQLGLTARQLGYHRTDVSADGIGTAMLFVIA